MLASTAGAVCYGNRLAWVGMVLTLPEFRGRGFARRLMEHMLHYLDHRGIGCIKLDATEMGRDLYRKLGFAEECAIERWARAPGQTPVSHLSSFLLDGALDREVFGAERWELLQQLSRLDAVSIPKAGYAMGRPGRLAAYFGPCIAPSPEAARSLLDWYLARHGSEPICWDLLPDNQEAPRLAHALGFQRSRQLVRMVRVRDSTALIHSKTPSIYGIAGFEYG